MFRNAFVIVSLLVWSANARGEADESAKPVENAEDLPAAVGSRISVTGIAKNAKLWAVIDGDDFVINLADLERWPDDAIDRKVIVEGKLTIHDYGPQSKREVKQAGKNYELREADWRLAVADSEAKPDRSEPTLIITAVNTYPSGERNEFLILRREGDRLAWKATSSFPRDDASRLIGAGPECEVNLVDVFETVVDAGRPDQGVPPAETRNFCSLLLITGDGAKATGPLTIDQQTLMGKLLRPVFDDVLKNGPYAKQNVMLYFLYAEHALRATGEQKGPSTGSQFPGRPSASQTEK